MGGSSGSGSGHVSPKDNLPQLAVPQWFTDGQLQVLNKIRNAKTMGEIYEAMSELARLGRKLSHDVVKARPPLEPRQLYEATLAQSPADAPLVITVDPALQNRFDALLKDQLAEGKNERGGTLVWAPSGKWELANEGSSNSGHHFYPDLKVAGDHTAVGSFHTHVQTDVLDRSPDNPKGLSDVAPGGGDIAYFLENKQSVAIVHSANKEFLLLRTDSTPANVDADKLRREHQAELDAGKIVGRKVYSEAEVTQRLASEYAQKYGFAYYEGENGTFKRVVPPS